MERQLIYFLKQQKIGGDDMSLWKTLTARWGSGAGETDAVRIDASTNALESIDYAHHEIHSGSHFEYTEYDAALDATNTIDVLITVPNTTKWPHMIFSVDGALQTLVQVFETCTHTAGAAKTPYNNNRNSATANTTLLNVSNDDAADGTAILQTMFGISTGVGNNSIVSGGGARGDNEMILKQNTKYLFRVTSFTDDNVVSLKLVWYEHTDKN